MSAPLSFIRCLFVDRVFPAHAGVGADFNLLRFVNIAAHPRDFCQKLNLDKGLLEEGWPNTCDVPRESYRKLIINLFQINRTNAS